MKAHEPWDVNDFDQYIPRVKHGYFPLHLYLELLSPFPNTDTMQLRSNAHPDSSPEPGMPSVATCRSRGCPLVQRVFTRSDTPYILPICSNYGLGKRFPTEECEDLLNFGDCGDTG